MDLNYIKNKLESFQNKGSAKEKINYELYIWRPKPGKHQIRIVPSISNKSTPFKEIYYHYGYTNAPILALNNWGEADPIIEAAQQLRKSSNPEDWNMAKKIFPKLRIFVPVIVRGEEEKGVRMWEFGKNTYTQLLTIAMNEDYGDYTSIKGDEGRDFMIETVEEMGFGKKITKSSITPRVKTTPLSNDPELIEKWISEQPDILSLNKKYTYDELNKVFKDWVNASEEEPEPQPSSIGETPEESVDKLPFEDEVLPLIPKRTKSDKFSDLFEDKK